jgi:hypothetical protein
MGMLEIVQLVKILFRHSSNRPMILAIKLLTIIRLGTSYTIEVCPWIFPFPETP